MLRGPLGEERGAGTARGDSRGGDREGGGVCGPVAAGVRAVVQDRHFPNLLRRVQPAQPAVAPECEGALGLGVEREAPSPEIFSAPGNPSGLRVLRPGLPGLPWSSEGNRSLDLIGSA